MSHYSSLDGPDKKGRAIYIGEHGTYPVPQSVLDEADKLSPGLSRRDGRTRAYKFIDAWGKEQDRMTKVRADIADLKPSWFDRLLSWIGL